MRPLKKQFVFIFAALALALGACAHKQPAATTAPAQVQQVYYVEAGPFKTLRFAPPPAPGSMEEQADIAAVLAWQNKRTAVDCANSSRTSMQDFDSLWGEKSPFADPLPAEVKDFFARLASDLEEAVNSMKNRYQRPRPYMAYSEAQPCIKKSKGFSYPSGHSSYASVYANVMTDIVPERKAEFFAKADEIAQDRVIGGVHYPADIAAGKVFGDLYHSELLKSDAYREDIGKIKALLVK
jgi:acid phosphatase (class A)